jgi:hypothetical protein
MSSLNHSMTLSSWLKGTLGTLVFIDLASKALKTDDYFMALAAVSFHNTLLRLTYWLSVPVYSFYSICHLHYRFLHADHVYSPNTRPHCQPFGVLPLSLSRYWLYCIPNHFLRHLLTLHRLLGYAATESSMLNTQKLPS